MAGNATIAVVIPCHNEQAAIAAVIEGFRAALPGALLVVADNNSTDATASIARDCGALVLHESRKGKGYAMRRLFADVDADCYVMVDGDDTYDPRTAPEMVKLVTGAGFDMVNGARVSVAGHDTYRPGHALGNRVLTWIFQALFGLELEDTLSGYRAMSRRFVKSFPTGASGFEIEAELNAHAAVLNVPVTEVSTDYRERGDGSASKLNTYRDGVRILRRNLRLFRDARPALAFFLLSLPWLIGAAALIAPPVLEYLNTGLVSRFPSLIVGVGCLLVAVLTILAGVIMQRTALNRIETCRLFYLAEGGAHLDLPPANAADVDTGRR